MTREEYWLIRFELCHLYSEPELRAGPPGCGSAVQAVARDIIEDCDRVRKTYAEMHPRSAQLEFKFDA